MPIFEYRCNACGEQIEKISSKPQDEIPCPTCGKPAAKVLSVFATSGSSKPDACPSGGCAPSGGSGFR